jgi:catechol 2,3-dioxygenase-like lactoylglutathione lyase family enzyme
MPIDLNHTIVYSRDAATSALFLTEILGLAPPGRFGHFHTVETGNGVSLDYSDTDQPISNQHYAFLVGDPDFDEIFGRIEERGLDYWADPARTRPGEINHRDKGRGVYFPDPDGHFLEILTRPYASAG